MALGAGTVAWAWGGKVRLARTYRPGRSMVYQTRVETHATVHSTPEGLTAFLPPLPTEFKARQQNTVTVRAVHPEGTVDIETRFDEFEFHSNLVERLAEKDRAAAAQAEQEFGRRLAGETLTVHYDGDGHLRSFEGADNLLRQVDAPYREPLHQLIGFFLEQLGGQTLYPGHEVRPGDEWKRRIDSPSSDLFPFELEGENTLRYMGKTRYHGVKAGVVDYRFTSVVKPGATGASSAGPFAPLAVMGVTLDLGIDGQGRGRALVALDDGRLLENRSTLRQKLSARLKSSPRGSAPASQPLSLDLDSETRLEIDGQ